ncbi:unnamed protein product, partial [Nesidiocoris tenuis]
MEDYVNEILSLAQQLASMDKEIDDEFLAAIMLQGLTDTYDPMIMALESSGAKITTDFVKTKLLQDTKWHHHQSGADEPALMVRKQKKKPFCFRCKSKTHYTNQCSGPSENNAPFQRQATSQNFKQHFPQQNPNFKNKAKGNKALFAAFGTNMKSDCWYVDSGATTHMSGRSDWLNNIRKIDAQRQIIVANNEKLDVEGIGTASVTLSYQDTRDVSDVMYIPNLAANLLSVNALVKNGFGVAFDINGCRIFDTEDFHVEGEPIAIASNVDGLFKLRTASSEQVNIALSSSMSDHTLWHRRLGHLNHYSMVLLKDKLATGLSFDVPASPQLCVSCVKGKQSRKPYPFKKDKQVAENKLDLIHSDVLGPVEVASWSGKRYMLTFIDDHSRKVFVYFLHNKSEVPEVFDSFRRQVETATGRKVKILRTDNGGEYCNRRMANILIKHGIKHERTVAHCPSQNGLAERYMRSIMEKARALIADSNQDLRMWAEAANTAVYLLNRSPAKKIPKSTPEEKWSGHRVDLSHLKIFGCPAFCHIPKANRKKLDFKSKEYVFVGYSEEIKGYRLFDPSSQNIKIARDITFDENFSTVPKIDLPSSNPPSSFPENTEVNEEDPSEVHETLRRSECDEETDEGPISPISTPDSAEEENQEDSSSDERSPDSPTIPTIEVSDDD